MSDVAEELKASHPDAGLFYPIAGRIPSSMKNDFWVALCDAIQHEVDIHKSESAKIKYLFSIDDAPTVGNLLNIGNVVYGYDRDMLENLTYLLRACYSSYGFGTITMSTVLSISGVFVLENITGRALEEYDDTNGKLIDSPTWEKSGRDYSDAFTKQGDSYSGFPTNVTVMKIANESLSYKATAQTLPIVPGSVDIILTRDGESRTVAIDNRRGGMTSAVSGFSINTSKSSVNYITGVMNIVFLKGSDFKEVLSTDTIGFSYGVLGANDSTVTVDDLTPDTREYLMLQKEMQKVPYYVAHKGSLDVYRSLFSFFGFSFVQRISMYYENVTAKSELDNRLNRLSFIRGLSGFLPENSINNHKDGIEEQSVPAEIAVGTATEMSIKLDDKVSSEYRKLDMTASTQDVVTLDIMTASTKRATRHIAVEVYVDGYSNAPVSYEDMKAFDSVYYLTNTSNTMTAYPYNTEHDVNKQYKTLLTVDILSYMRFFITKYKRAVDVIHLGGQVSFSMDESGHYDYDDNTDVATDFKYTVVPLLLRAVFNVANKEMFNDIASFSGKRVHVAFGCGSKPMSSKSDSVAVPFPVGCASEIADIEVEPPECFLSDGYAGFIAQYVGKTVEGIGYVKEDSASDRAWVLGNSHPSDILPFAQNTLMLVVHVSYVGQASEVDYIVSDIGGGVICSSDNKFVGTVDYQSGKVTFTYVWDNGGTMVPTITEVLIGRGFMLGNSRISEASLYVDDDPIAYCTFPTTVFNTNNVHLNFGIIIGKRPS